MALRSHPWFLFFWLAAVAFAQAQTPAPPGAAAPVPASIAGRPASPVDPGEFVRSRNGSLVIIKDNSGSGSGFIANFNGRAYLVSNAHVLAGIKQPVFTLLDGTRLTPVSMEAAVGHDIVRLGLKETPHDALEVGVELEQFTRINDEVFVFGNSGGGGVVTSLPGKLVGLGPDRIEVTSGFIPGNSGSPIIHARTGCAIGIATYLTRDRNEFGPKRGEVSIRRFGYRLDSVKTWQPVNYTLFQAEAAQLEKVEALSNDLIEFIQAIQQKKRAEPSTDTLRKPITELRTKLSDRHTSEVDRRNATQSFLTSMRTLSRSDVESLEKTLRYDYFQRELAKQRELRDQLYKDFDRGAQELAMPSTRGK